MDEILFCLEIYGEKGQKCLIFGNPTLLHLGEPEAPKLLVSASLRRRLLRLGIGLCLGEGPLCLGEPVVLF